MFGINLPSVSDVTKAVTGAASSALHTTEDLGSSALSQAQSLGRQGLDLGRSAVNAVSNINVQKLGSQATAAIGKAESWTEGKITSGVMAAGKGVHSAADYARSHITGADPLSKLARGAITVTEDQTRFDIGLVGGVGKAAVGLVGSAGQLSVMATEYQYSPSARAAIDAKIGGALTSGAKSVGGYLDSVAHDPSRVGGDIKGLASDAKGFVVGKYDEAKTAIAEGHGPESFGMVTGNAATYLIPVGGEVRAAAEIGEVGTRALVRGLAEDGTRTLAEDGTRAIAADGGKAAGGVAAADLESAGTIRNVNVVKGNMNCVNCAVATDSVLAGRPASALGGGPFKVNVLEKLFNAKFGPAQTADEIAKSMTGAGPGARGIVFGSRGAQVGHVFNVVNQGGTIRFLDGQTGKAAVTSGFSSLRLLRTN